MVKAQTRVSRSVNVGKRRLSPIRRVLVSTVNRSAAAAAHTPAKKGRQKRSESYQLQDRIACGLLAYVVAPNRIVVGTWYPGRGWWDEHHYWRHRERWHGDGDDAGDRCLAGASRTHLHGVGHHLGTVFVRRFANHSRPPDHREGGYGQAPDIRLLGLADSLTALPNRLALHEYFAKSSTVLLASELVAVHYLGLRWLQAGSTTVMVILPATRCLRQLPGGWWARSEMAISLPGWEATNSPSCSSASAARERLKYSFNASNLRSPRRSRSKIT